VVQKVLRSGRVAEQWLGGTKEVARRVSNTSCHDIIDRNGKDGPKTSSHTYLTAASQTLPFLAALCIAWECCTICVVFCQQ
jgi:hypothetical protein